MQRLQSKSWLTLLTVAACLACTQALADGPNLYVNPGFEDGYNGWSTFGSGPNISTPSTDNIARTDTAAAKLFGEFAGPFGAGGFFQTVLDTNASGDTLDLGAANDLFTLSGYGFVSSADQHVAYANPCDGNRAIAKLIFRNGLGQEIASNEIIVGNQQTPLDTWVPFSVSAEVPLGAKYLEAMILFLQPNPVDTGSVYIDDLLLCEGTPVALPNVLANGDFVTNLSGWGTFGNVFFDGRPAYAFPQNGLNPGAAKMFGTFVDMSPSGIFQTFAASPGSEWRLDAWALNTCQEDAIVDTNTNYMSARIVFRDGGGTELDAQETRLTDRTAPLGTWVPGTVYAKAPLNTATVEAYILFIQEDSTYNGAAWVDKVSFGQGSFTNVPGGAAPQTFRLKQNVPNPFNPTTRIPFKLDAREEVTLSVYDVTGRKVRTLLQESRAAGEHEVLWNGRSDSGEPVSSGTYFYSLETKSGSESRRMVLVK